MKKNRHLLRVTSDQLLLVHGGAVSEFKGDLDDYPRWLAESRAQESNNNESVEAKAHGASARKERKRQQAEQRRQLQPLRKKLQQAEQQVTELAGKQQELEQQLAEPELYNDENKETLKQLLSDKSLLDRALSEAEEAWLLAGEALEAAEENAGEL